MQEMIKDTCKTEFSHCCNVGLSILVTLSLLKYCSFAQFPLAPSSLQQVIFVLQKSHAGE